MLRRKFLGSLGTLCLGAPLLRAADAAIAEKNPAPTPAQLGWQEAELVAMFHFDLHLFDAPGEKHRHYDQGANRLRKFSGTDAFNPTEIDVEQWVRTAVAMGAKAAVMTSCHENGLRLWQSDANPYSLKTTRWGDGKRDLVREFVEACRKHGLKPGLFHCQRWNSLLRIHDYKPMPDCPMTQAAYYRMIEKEIEELTSRYGELFMLWFDGGGLTPDQGGADILPVFEKNQPGAIYYHSDQRRDLRWAGNEGGVSAPECSSNIDLAKTRTHNKSPLSYWGSGDPDGPDFAPALADTPLRARGGHEWFWEPGEEKLILPLRDLVSKYEKSVGRNATLVIGITPDNRGLVPDADATRLKEFGDAVRAKYGAPPATTSGTGAETTLAIPAGAKIDRVVFGENTRLGERVRAFVLEGRENAGAPWQKLAAGKVIGHKRIETFDARPLSEIRLSITASRGAPKIASLAAFRA